MNMRVQNDRPVQLPEVVVEAERRPHVVKKDETLSGIAQDVARATGLPHGEVLAQLKTNNAGLLENRQSPSGRLKGFDYLKPGDRLNLDMRPLIEARKARQAEGPKGVDQVPSSYAGAPAQRTSSTGQAGGAAVASRATSSDGGLRRAEGGLGGQVVANHAAARRAVANAPAGSPEARQFAEADRLFQDIQQKPVPGFTTGSPAAKVNAYLNDASVPAAERGRRQEVVGTLNGLLKPLGDGRLTDAEKAGAVGLGAGAAAMAAPQAQAAPSRGASVVADVATARRAVANAPAGSPEARQLAEANRLFGEIQAKDVPGAAGRSPAGKIDAYLNDPSVSASERARRSDVVGTLEDLVKPLGDGRLTGGEKLSAVARAYGLGDAVDAIGSMRETVGGFLRGRDDLQQGIQQNRTLR